MKPLGSADPREVGRYPGARRAGPRRNGPGALGCRAGRAAGRGEADPRAVRRGRRVPARFRREVDASRSVSGAYTAAVVDAAPDAPTPWLASVFVPGPKSLDDTLQTLGPLPEKSVLRLAAGLATALIQIHRAGLVHRDLKPSNVLLADDGPRVIDFASSARSTTTGRTSPERAGWSAHPHSCLPSRPAAKPSAAASDVFSLGSVLVAACTGASPFAAPSALQTLNNVTRAEPDLFRVPAAIRRIVEPCFAKDPAQRPTPSAVLDAIGSVAPSAHPWPGSVHRLSPSGRPSSPRSSTRPSWRQWSLRSRTPPVQSRRP